ncbi:DUF932 domain-containing protein [Natronococcus sp. A-GB1]|uniref:DUF932 domain-containing protein n=1 Tax=Natronococcus sp. A-GB1 TaxID=3037648 RepID=UPI00241FC608|nr:DUF932 domain-containing protein [Natronococcus sp. A-GB1]MDG5761330.1 DUF932 domain-containing protein [Natronococcus sp. A-GB1]
MIPLTGQLHTFDGITEFEELKQELAAVERHDIYAYHDDADEWAELPYRDSLWTNSGPVGDVSASSKYYHVFQPAEIIEYEVHALEQYRDTVRPKGYIRESADGRKLTVYTNLEGLEVEPVEGDVYELGKRTSHAHTGMHGLHHDIGAVRVVCSNGMMSFDAEKQFSQTHSEPLNYALFEHAYDSIVNGVEDVEDRIQAAAAQELVNQDEALLVLTDLNIDTYLPGDEPLATLEEALETELDMEQDRPTLYDTYNAATRALTHAPGIEPDSREQGLKQAARLLDHQGAVPEATDLGQSAVERRLDAYVEDETEPYWDDEEETLQTLIETHAGER